MLRFEQGTDKQDRHRSQINPSKSTFHYICLYVYTVHTSFMCIRVCLCLTERVFTFMYVCSANINLALVFSIAGKPTKSVTSQPSAIG